MNSERQLLEQYAAQGDEAAFTRIVQTYAGMVHATALRRLNGNSALAEDVTQQVFMDLASKARQIPAQMIIAGWLHRHTLFLASNTLRSQSRRQQRELAASLLHEQTDAQNGTAEDLTTELDAALDDLEEEDRTVLILRFLHQKDLRSVGDALGLSEGAAQKRVSRALERLRLAFTQRGRTVSIAVLLASLSQITVTPANAALVSKLSSAAAPALTGAQTNGEPLTNILLMKKSSVALVALLTIGIIVPLFLQQRIQSLESKNERLEKLHRSQEETQDQLKQTNNRLQNQLARMQTDLNTLRADISRLSAPEAQPPQPHPAKKASPQTAKTAPTNNVPVAEWFTMDGVIPVNSGETIITGGWEVSAGSRYFTLISPKIDESGHIMLNSVLLSIPSDKVAEIGFSELITEGKAATTYGLTGEEQTRNLLALLNSMPKVDVLSSPKILTTSGQQAEIAVGDGIRLNFTPKIQPNGTSLNVEMSAALKATATP